MAEGLAPPRAVARRPLELDSRRGPSAAEGRATAVAAATRGRCSQPLHRDRSPLEEVSPRPAARGSQPGLDADDLLLERMREGAFGRARLRPPARGRSGIAALRARAPAQRIAAPEQPQGAVERRVRSGGVSAPTSAALRASRDCPGTCSVDGYGRVRGRDRRVVIAAYRGSGGQDGIRPELPGAPEFDRALGARHRPRHRTHPRSRLRSSRKSGLASRTRATARSVYGASNPPARRDSRVNAAMVPSDALSCSRRCPAPAAAIATSEVSVHGQVVMRLAHASAPGSLNPTPRT